MTGDRALLTGAGAGFTLALMGLLGMATLCVLGGDEGRIAVAAIAGLGQGAEPGMLRLAAGCDTLLPIGYAIGLCLMAVGLSQGPGAFVVVAFTTLGLTADVIENGLTLTGSSASGIATFAKFVLLGAAGMALVTLIPVADGLTRLARGVGWFGLPLALAAIAADLPLSRDPLGFVVGLAALFAVLLILCHRARA